MGGNVIFVGSFLNLKNLLFTRLVSFKGLSSTVVHVCRILNECAVKSLERIISFCLDSRCKYLP